MSTPPRQLQLVPPPPRLTRRQGVDLQAEILRRNLTIEAQREVIDAQSTAVKALRADLARLREDNEHLRRVIASLRGGGQG